MRESELRPVLLVKAIEESDAEGALLPAADRLAATKQAKREAPPPEPLRMADGALPAAAERLLARRAAILLAQVRARHPFVEEIVAFSPGAWISLAACAAAFAIGVALSALDGTRRINVLAFPLWGVVAWNLTVYVVVMAAWARSLSTRRRPRRWIPEWIAQATGRRLSSMVARARRFHAPLAQALVKFVSEWQEASRPLVAARAATIFHVAAAALGAGLIAGFYLRGIALDYQAGWESTFLDAGQARALLAVLYGPASALTGIAIPDSAHLEAIRWHGATGGERAAPWIHLLAATALIFVVLPRLVFAGVSALSAWGAARRSAQPASMPAYFERAFRDVGVTLAGGGVRVIPYAYEPTADSQERLRALFPETSVDVQPRIAYGEEEKMGAAVETGEAPASVALLFTSAATPEEDSHGRVMDIAREAARLRSTRLEAIVDEGPYAARMGATLEARVEERRRAWRQLASAHGIEPRFVDLSR